MSIESATASARNELQIKILHLVSSVLGIGSTADVARADPTRVLEENEGPDRLDGLAMYHPPRPIPASLCVGSEA